MKTGLFASDTGGDGPALVLLHGLGGTHRVWDGVRAALGAGFRTVVYDLPGHGRSLDFPAGGAGSVAKALLADLTARGIGRFHLGGHSFGGAVAALAALQAPERVISLALLAPGGITPEINAALLRDYAAATNREEIARCLSEMTGEAPVPETMIAGALQMRALPGQIEALTALCAAILHGETQGAILPERLAELKLPGFVAWGERDAVLPVRQAECLPARFARHIFPSLGHMLPEEASQEMARLLRHHVGQVPY